MKSITVSIALLFFMAACTSVPERNESLHGRAAADTQIAPFSINATGKALAPWESMIIQRDKKRTEYALVADRGRIVLHARAVASASGLMQKVDIDPMHRSHLQWQWRISGPVETADNADRTREDAPARIILAFDGDKDALPFSDQILFETARVLTGRDLPYATLMYIWGSKVPVGSIIPNARSGRIQMAVAENGRDGVGEWQTLSRDIVADYERAFGAKPGRLIGVVVLTDTDNTGETVEAWYGDIRLTR